MLPAGCLLGLVAELQVALDTCAEQQRQLEQSLRVSRRQLRAWDPPECPAPEATPGCQTDQEAPAYTPSPGELQELQLLTEALEKAARVRRGVSQPAARDRVPRLKVGCTPALSRAGLAAEGSKPPRGSHQPPLPSRTTGRRPPLVGIGDPAGPSPAAQPSANPAAAPAPKIFTLKEQGTLLRLPVAFRTAAATNSRLWDELNSASIPVDAASARARFLQQMRPARGARVEPCGAEVGRLRKACSVLRWCLRQELAEGPAEPRREYRRLLMLDGLRDAADKCLRRLQELRTAVPEPGPEGPAVGASPRCGRPWGPQPLVYTSTQELQTLAALRLRVSMLEQQLHLQEVLMAQLLPVLRAQQPSGTPELVLYRAAHSLLCEGGEGFVSILRDEPAD